MSAVPLAPLSADPPAPRDHRGHRNGWRVAVAATAVLTAAVLSSPTSPWPTRQFTTPPTALRRSLRLHNTPISVSDLFAATAALSTTAREEVIAAVRNDPTVQAAWQYVATNPTVQTASEGLVEETTTHPGVLLFAAALAASLVALWANRRTLLWRLAQSRGQAQGPNVILGKYLIRQAPRKPKPGSAFGLVSPVWNVQQALMLKVSRDRESWDRERDIFRRLRGGGGPIVELYDAERNYDGSGANALIQEYGDGGNLRAYIDEQGPLPVPEVRRIGRSILGALARLHAAGLVWCDCKPENFVFVQGQLKAIDFETVSKEGTDVFGFSPDTAPPELAIWKGMLDVEDIFPARKSFDMWSLGMILLHAYRGQPYWGRDNPQAVVNKLRDPSFEVKLSNVRDPLLKNLLAWLLQRDPKKRPSALQAGLHPFFLLL
jgi:hypothetical protein